MVEWLLRIHCPHKKCSGVPGGLGSILPREVEHTAVRTRKVPCTHGCWFNPGVLNPVGGGEVA